MPPCPTTIDYDIAMEVASHEAIIRQAYKDSEGVWTWSVGLTSMTGHNVERYIDAPQPLEHCLAIYVWALDNYAAAVREVFAGHPLTKAQFAAALSFHWNTGGIKRASWVDHFKAGRLHAAEKAFKAWNKPAEIRRRRAKEADLLFRGKWSNNGRMTEYTKLTPRHTPMWGSALSIDVEDLLKLAIGSHTGPIMDKPPRPEPDNWGGLFALLLRLIKAVFPVGR